ncbi:hypothetical protein DFS33DRAFT_1081022 [Desarmillaria ectypa]|nr:hypothetical protein DFS33DRAFT_1081022 [Desarmillaria ectypa]
MSTTSPLPDHTPRHASTLDINQAESGFSQLQLENSLSDGLTVDGSFYYRVPALNEITLETPLDLLYRHLHEEPSLEYFPSKGLASAYGKLFDVYKQVQFNTLGLIQWYTHPNFLRILLSYRNFCEYNRCLDSSCRVLVADILQEIQDSRSDTVHLTFDIRKRCKALGLKIEGEIFVLQTLMERRHRLFNMERVFRVVKPLIMYSVALFFASGTLISFTLLIDTSGKHQMVGILLMLFSAVLGFASFSARKYMYKVYDAINEVYKHSYLNTLACLDLAEFLLHLGESEGSLPGMSRAAMSLESFQTRFLGGGGDLFNIHSKISDLPEYNKEEHEFWLEERLWAATKYHSISDSAARKSETSSPFSIVVSTSVNHPHSSPQSPTTTLTFEVPGNSSALHGSSPTPSSTGQTSTGTHVQPASTFFRRRHSPIHSH